MPEKKLPREPYEKYWPYLRKVAKRLTIESLKLSEKQITHITVSRKFIFRVGIESLYVSVNVYYDGCCKLALWGIIHTDSDKLRVRFLIQAKRSVDTILEVGIPLTATKKEAIQLVEDSILAARL